MKRIIFGFLNAGLFTFMPLVGCMLKYEKQASRAPVYPTEHASPPKRVQEECSPISEKVLLHGVGMHLLLLSPPLLRSHDSLRFL